MARSSVAPTPATKGRTKSALTPEDYLARALNARSPALRAKYARLGLAIRAPLERTTHAMLLRQLYMAYYETRRFRKAREVALQALELGIMVDVLHQDVARACIGLHLDEEAIGHLRLAARRGPASRRAFHLWTLGSLLFLLNRHVEAIGCLERAARWGTTDKPLYQAHAALVRLARGEPTPEAPELFERLEQAPCGQGYGRFVLGQLAFQLRRWDEARRYLEAFLDRIQQARPAMALSLAGELEAARTTLARMRSN
ncbi:MAG: hypothetical protein RMJ98_02660 [Myxococcales bacterium]|nr:hypothetical protein [Myxococcales bacterium]